MNIIGKKIILRAIEPDDMDMLQDMVNDPDIETSVVGWSFPVSKADQIRWYENILNDKSTLRFIIETKSDREAIGMIYFAEIDWKNRSAETGIKLKKNAPKRQGYATDAVTTLWQYAFFELQLNRLSFLIMEYNEASIGLHEKCGAVREGIKRNAVYKGGKYHNQYYYGVLKENFEEIKNGLNGDEN
jgi:Acetyltransferases, including N-acetylases of ribosomal proteins